MNRFRLRLFYAVNLGFVTLFPLRINRQHKKSNKDVARNVLRFKRQQKIRQQMKRLKRTIEQTFLCYSGISSNQTNVTNRLNPVRM